jgi:hypothetical protein
MKHMKTLIIAFAAFSRGLKDEVTKRLTSGARKSRKPEE